MKGPRTVQVLLTVEMARRFLGNNFADNRRVVASIVDRYARDILAGLWRLNGEALKVSVDGQLLDGQHRCLAVIKAAIPISTFVVYDVEPGSFPTFDTGKSRTLGDLLHDNTLAASVTLLFAYRNGALQSGIMGRQATPTRQQSLELLLANPGIKNSVKKVPHGGRLLTRSLMGFLHYVLSEVDESFATVFLQRVVKGEGLATGDPVLALRRRLIDNLSAPTKWTARDKIILCISAWNACLANESRDVVRIARRPGRVEGSTRSVFPKISGVKIGRDGIDGEAS